MKPSMMKKWLFLLLFCTTGVLSVSAQADSPAYKRFPTVPPLQLLQVDSTPFTKDNLKKHQALLIMYFSPSCDHCKHQWEDMTKNMKTLKKYQVLMVTYQPFEEMVDFYKTQHISDYSNIKLARDPKFVLPPFFRIQSLPFMALYDKKGNLITTFEGNVKMDKVFKAFNENSK